MKCRVVSQLLGRRKCIIYMESKSQPSQQLLFFGGYRVICANVVGATSSGRFLVSRNDMHYRVGDKNRRHRLMTIILSNLNRFKKKFTGRFLSKFAVKRILKIPPHLAYFATLACETLTSAKQAIND